MSVVDQVMFSHVIAQPDEQIRLDVAALLVAEEEHPGLDIAHYVSVLDGFADTARTARDTSRLGPFAPIRALNRALFETLGFRGNEDNYYDPANSFLHQVIDRRVGIPITLSVIYMEVARRMGIAVEGINFPGHFLVRYQEGRETLVIDPYHMGLILNPTHLRDRLRRVMGASAELSGDMLSPATNREIIGRLLLNLAGIYRREGDVLRTIAILERILILRPDDHGLESELEVLRARVAELN